MAMSVGSGGGDDEVMIDINTTPLIDVMLVLLIMLIITIPVQTHAVKLDFPPPPPPVLNPPPPPPVVDIVVDFNGDIYWNNEIVPDRPTLEAKFQAIGAQPKDDQPEIHLRPNKLVEYKYVAEVMAEAQRNGAVKIALLGNEQFADQQ
jgi:biopolymer transport protein ExbD